MADGGSRSEDAFDASFNNASRIDKKANWGYPDALSPSNN
jgi:hypothetical protein